MNFGNFAQNQNLRGNGMARSKYDNKFLDFVFGSKVQILCYVIFAVCVFALAINHFTNGEFLKL